MHPGQREASVHNPDVKVLVLAAPAQVEVGEAIEGGELVPGHRSHAPRVLGHEELVLEPVHGGGHVEHAVLGAPVEKALALRDVVHIVENETVRVEGEDVLGREEAGIEEEASHEGGIVSLVDNKYRVLYILPHKERVHVLEEGGQMGLSLPDVKEVRLTQLKLAALSPVGDEDGHPGAGLAPMRPVVTPGPQPPRPGLVLRLELEVNPAIRELIGQLGRQHGLGAEHGTLVTELQPSLSLIACIEAQIN